MTPQRLITFDQHYKPKVQRSRAGPAAGDINPLGQARALLALDVDDIGVTAAAAAHAILLLRVPLVPVLVLLEPLLVVQRRLLEPRLPRQLARRRVGRAVLDRRVAIPKVAEVVDVARRQERAGCQRVDGRVTPLQRQLAYVVSKAQLQVNVPAPSRSRRCPRRS